MNNIQNNINQLESQINKMNKENIEYDGVKHIWQKMKEKSASIDWINNFDYKYFTTITFINEQKESTSKKQLCEILKMINKDYFKNRNKNKEHFEGFVFTEKQASGNIHFHILFRENIVFNAKRNRNKEFERVFKEKCRLIRNAIPLKDGIEYIGKNTIDPDIGVDVQEVYDENIVEYCMKDHPLFSKNIDNVGILNYDGFE
ncbi:hypothetical protein A7E78_03800 [Syntrophotalea acetylenivorans]|uniref:Replication-associated protein ORF2/G2P domain-containing protein n=1 Tax=Syntrophotalea acetylenivorans TaxID=1842532 RepID=A0A1L3GMB7_9BACT|nr:hypothetical protein [Syntrophotalea acetylenivorans]APG27031.1 hypothetical protein A7E78_03800 [Syntrophotalea acetylenivorans]